MFHIIGMILKILGILILILLGILLLALLVILLVPIRYEVNLQRYGKFYGKGKISWLISIFKLEFAYSSENGLVTQVKIFGRGKKEESQESSPEEAEEVEDFDSLEPQIKALEREIEEDSKLEQDVRSAAQAVEESTLKETQSRKRQTQPIREEKEEDTDEIKNLSLKERLREIYQFLKTPSVKKTVKKIFIRVKKLAKKILPGKLQADIRFGFDDPAITGQVLAIASMFYALYYECVNVEPDFENEVLEGHIYSKGKIRLLYFVSFTVKTAIDLWFNREIREFIKSKLRRE